MALTANQQEVMDRLADGKPHRGVFFSASAALRLASSTREGGPLVKTWLQRGPSPTGNLQRWFQKL